MKKSVLWGAIALTLMATTAVTGCSNDNEKADPWICTYPTGDNVRLTRAEQEMVNSCNAFAFNLFRTAQSELKGQVLSPLSITYALGMLNNGAAGNTQAQINKVLGFGNTGADSINVFCNKMLNMASSLDPLTKVLIANNIYLNKGYELKADFVAKAKAYYDAEPETRDFNDGQTKDVINKWAADHTEQMITKLLDEKSFDPDYVSYLLNAIYFKGSWSSKFNKEETIREEFYHAGTTEEMTYADMMHQTARFEYAVSNGYQALRLPYGNGSFLMTVLLPLQTKSVNNLPTVPTVSEWQQLNQEMDSALVDVMLPRFETSTDIDLKDIMKKLGMTDAFDEEAADFRNFCNVPVYIGLMKQVAKIKVDEEGSEAAAVTVIGMDNKSASGPSYIAFHANHPFLYVISERQTGAVFFIGQYTGY